MCALWKATLLTCYPFIQAEIVSFVLGPAFGDWVDPLCRHVFLFPFSLIFL